MSSSTNRLMQVIALLEALYGVPSVPAITDVFDMIVWENVAYLVDDDRRSIVFNTVREKTRLEPEAILATKPDTLAHWIKAGGMQPDRRAEKLFTCARLALEIGLPELRKLMRLDVARARRELMRFPGIGEPSADRLLLFARCSRSLAPDSNSLRALVRLGFSVEDDNYARMYRTTAAAVAAWLPDDYDWLIRAHQLLKTHGKVLCKRTAPRCEACPLSGECGWYAMQRERS